jgi:hypothetical protein
MYAKTDRFTFKKLWLSIADDYDVAALYMERVTALKIQIEQLTFETAKQEKVEK